MAGLPSEVDVAVIGAGAAGIAAGRRLAAPIEDRLFFAGEACSPNFFSTAHGAYKTGLHAAEAALATLP
jgi:NADPH-dependent glutamate synthase beta subunit-like oxidoreductase